MRTGAGLVRDEFLQLEGDTDSSPPSSPVPRSGLTQNLQEVQDEGAPNLDPPPSKEGRPVHVCACV